MPQDIRAKLRLAPGPVRLAELPTGSHPGLPDKKKKAKKALKKMGPELTDLQEKLFAEAYTGADRGVLLVLQGMDTSGKGGVSTHTAGLLRPDALRLTSFKKPTEEELSHDFLWRIDKAVPGPGKIGVFDRSHYEDVLVTRVRELVDQREIERRYEAINDWEQRLVESGTTVIKAMLHISPETQKERFLARLDRKRKVWKFRADDLADRARWADFQEAYELALERTNTEHAPWYVVPSDHKWYRNWAIGRLLLETLRELDPHWPKPDFDVEEQRLRLENETPPASPPVRDE